MLDTRTKEMKQKMAQHFEEMEEEYRESEWCSIEYEDEELVLIADHKGYEWSEWQEQFDAHEFSEAMHELAVQLTNRRWPSDYPIVFDKLE